MCNLYSVKDINLLLNKYNFCFSKGLGQNFISSPHLCPKIVSKSGITEKTGVIEIGPGIGVLTREIASRAKKVVSVEIDKRLLPILSDTVSFYDNVKIINNDILKVNINGLIQDEFRGFEDIKVCANLPYYITSAVIMKLLEEDSDITSMTLMVQREAADRICALPGSRECGALSLAIRYYADSEILFKVSRSCFIPSPKVDSSVIKITKNSKNSANIIDKNTFFRTVKSSFSQRRKTVVNSLSSEFALNKDSLNMILCDLNISLKSRPEQLSFVDFGRLSNSIYDRII